MNEILSFITKDPIYFPSTILNELVWATFFCDALSRFFNAIWTNKIWKKRFEDTLMWGVISDSSVVNITSTIVKTTAKQRSISRNCLMVPQVKDISLEDIWQKLWELYFTMYLVNTNYNRSTIELQCFGRVLVQYFSWNSLAASLGSAEEAEILRLSW